MYYHYPMSECMMNNIRPGDIYVDGISPYSTWVLVLRDYIPVVGYASDFRKVLLDAVDGHDFAYHKIETLVDYWKWNGECYVKYEHSIPVFCINPDNVPAVDKIPWYRQLIGLRHRVRLGKLMIPLVTRDWHFAINRTGGIIDYTGKYHAPRGVFNIFYATSADLSELTGFTIRLERIDEYVFSLYALRTNPMPHLGWVVYPRVAEGSFTIAYDKVEKEIYLKDFKYNTWNS